MPTIKYNNNLKKISQTLRKSGVLSEALLWNELKSKKMKGFQFLRQKPIDKYVVDFYCKKLRLVIEIDGISHDAKIEEDVLRQNELESFGVVFLRFLDNEVKKNIDSVLREIKEKITSLPLADSRVLPSKGE